MYDKVARDDLGNDIQLLTLWYSNGAMISQIYNPKYWADTDVDSAARQLAERPPPAGATVVDPPEERRRKYADGLRQHYAGVTPVCDGKPCICAGGDPRFNQIGDHKRDLFG